MKRIAVVSVLVALGCAALVWADSDRGGGNASFTRLSGFQEVPAVSTTGYGELRLTLSDDSIEYELSYADLEGATTAASHVHLGQKSVNGGVMFFLCGGGGRPACTPTSGTFTGTVVAADIIGPAGQGISALEFAEAVRAIRAGVAYVNVHTDKHPGGEIRGQINSHGNQ